MKVEFNFTQSGVIPFRVSNNELEVLLITSITKKKWIIPKGYIEFNLSPFESAKKEAYEEAGVLGSNETVELGFYDIKKSIGVCRIIVFALKVTEILNDYPEMEKRQRRWFQIDEAMSMVEIPEIKKMIIDLPLKIF